MADGTEGKPQSILLVGGPDSGKTNFVVRSWLAIKRGNGLVCRDGNPDKLEYLEAGVQKLLCGEFVEHTPREVYNENKIPCVLVANAQRRPGVLVIPDCGGEQWMEIYHKREWSTAWEEQISDRCSCLVFVRASSKEIIAPLDWVQCEHVLGAPVTEAGDLAKFEARGARGAGGAENDKEIEDQFKASTQVVLSEWLHFMRKAFTARVASGFRPRVGIVVAAWDRVPRDRQGDGPLKYIAREFPLLSQYLSANDDQFDFAAFGVSVAGGDFDDEPGFKEQCLSQSEDPLTFGYVVYEHTNQIGNTSDLTYPLAWAMGH
jgi:hypothetical protein